MTDVYTPSVCVCVVGAADEWVPLSHEQQNRRTAACVFDHTHGFGMSTSLDTTYYCIQYNYIQQTNSEINPICIQNDYTGGVADAGA